MSSEIKKLYGSGTAHLLDPSSDCLTRFLAGSFNLMIYRCRYVLFLLFVGLGIAGVYVATGMGPLTKGEEMMHKDMQVIRTQDIMLDVFDTGLGTPSTLSVQVTWGVKELDRSQIKDWDPTDVGILVWDDKFNVAPPENQQAILDFCNMLEFESDVVKDGIVECWIKMFDTFVRKETN